MKTVGVRELKTRLSHYLREVRQGEEVLVTDRGEVVAELRRPDQDRTGMKAYPGLVVLAKRGSISVGGDNDQSLYPLLKPILPPGSASRLLDQERGER